MAKRDIAWSMRCETVAVPQRVLVARATDDVGTKSNEAGCFARLRWHVGCPTKSMNGSVSARIDEIQRRAAQTPGLISLGGGLPDASFFPKEELGEAFHCALSRRSEALQYGWPEGEPELREWVSARLQARGADLLPEHVVITSGAQQAISLSARVLFESGQTMGMQAESYPGAIHLLRSLGLRFVSWRVPAHGYYLMPAMANPGGISMNESQRTFILERIERDGSTLIEDDAYAEVIFNGKVKRPLVADAPERVVHVGTISKVLCPGLRVGWIATRNRVLREIVLSKHEADLQAGQLAQRILIEYLKAGHYEHHIARVCGGYEHKAAVLERAVRRHLPGFHVPHPEGGFSVWVQHEERGLLVDEIALLAGAVEEGVSFDPGSSFRTHGSDRLGFRLCHSAVSAKDIEPGVERLAQALVRVCSQHEREMPRVESAE